MKHLLLILLFFTTCSVAESADKKPTQCDPDNGGITLSPGFCATIFADNIGHVRHITVSDTGVVYANTWSGKYYAGQVQVAGSMLVALQDTTGDGKANVIKRFGQTLEQGSKGGTGIALYKGALYAETNDRIVRYKMHSGEIAPIAPPEVIVSGLPIDGDHNMHPFIIDAKGNVFVDLGSATNACQIKDRELQSPGHQPCSELETRGGTWRYDANTTDQIFSPKERYATGLRNGEGFALDSAGRLFVTQHGRDQLFENWPKIYSSKEGQELPAEVVVQLQEGADYGWPYCYFDGMQKKIVLAPEYGGDGKKVGICDSKQGPVAFFPAHWAPNAMTLYNRTEFPAPYRNGLYIAFHGSWNRAPGPQGGYNVVYQPMTNGKPSGDFIVFADGFAGTIKEPAGAAFRPSGIAVGPDGALYIGDDQHGRIWRVVYNGDPTITKISPAPSPKIAPEKLDTSAIDKLPLPPGVTLAQIQRGSQIFHGSIDNGTCSGCHGSSGKGSALGSDLTSGHWIWADGSLESITHIITTGVAKPKNHVGVMPPMGGAQLSPADINDVAAYVWSISQQNK